MTEQKAHAMQRFVPDHGNTRLLRDAFGRFTTGVTIVTTASDEGPVAIVANSFSSVSLDPPLVLWSPARDARRFHYFEQAESFAIHVLAAEQEQLCWQVARDVHVLQTIECTQSPEGIPLINNCLARFECHREATHEGGDHLIVVGRVLRAELRDGDPLAFYSGRSGRITQV